MEEGGRLQGKYERTGSSLSALPEVQTQNNCDYIFAGWTLEIIPYLISELID